MNKKRQSLLFLFISIFAICLLVGGSMLFLGAPIISDNLEAETDIKNTASSETIKTSGDFDDNTIEIIGNDQLEDKATDGDGTSDDPYIIKNLRIQAGYDQFGILIRNTDDHFKIENVNVIDSWSSTYGAFNLENVTNGKLINNTATNSTMGFRLKDSKNNNLTENFAEQNALGFRLTNSTSNNLTSNIANNNNDNIEGGEGNGFWIEVNSDNNTFTENTATNNDLYGFSFDESDNNTLTENTINNNGDGIILGKSHNCTMDGNTVSKNEGDGIILAESGENTINNNTANENKDYGLRLGDSNYNTITNNTFKFNEDGCIKEQFCIENYFDNNICENPEVPDDPDDSEGDIPGYNFLIVLGITAIIVSFLLNKSKKIAK